jgi:parvulin-like peptidyl-prolyl isomerase
MTKYILLSAAVFLGITALAQGQTSTPTPIATINGAVIRDSDLEGVEGELLQLRKQEYDIKKKALDSLIEQRLIEAEAARLGVTLPQLYEREVNAKVREPSDV